jgi:hypothetical protein
VVRPVLRQLFSSPPPVILLQQLQILIIEDLTFRLTVPRVVTLELGPRLLFFLFLFVPGYQIEIPIDSGMGVSITSDKIRVFINKPLSTQSLINQLLIKRVALSISIDSR